jgi:thiosulfate/3-mercaptopyruvate sulfurtransferase
VAFDTLIDVPALVDLRSRGAAVVLDCRFDLMNPAAGYNAYLAGHIPGARYADLNRDLAAPVTPASGRHPLPEPETFAATLDEWGIGNGTQVIAYDESNGMFAARAWWMLRWLGHRAAAVLDGGFKAWLAAGGAVAQGEEPASPAGATPSPGHFVPRVDATALVGADEVARLLRDARHLVVDARAAERFRGAVEPIDAVAGHIRGAVNHPFTGNLGADGRFLPPSVLRSRWEERIGGRSPGNVVAMCGSGVTACHNLLSLEVAGLHGAKLYAGSWSEWIRDPRRPVERGS